jgi:hypothetical protein
MTADIRCTVGQFIAKIDEVTGGLLLQRQTPEEPDGLPAESFLDLLADIDAYNKEAGRHNITCRVETSVVENEDEKRMPTRTAKLVLSATSNVLLSQAELDRLVELFGEYVEETTDMRDVLNLLATARSK